MLGVLVIYIDHKYSGANNDGTNKIILVTQGNTRKLMQRIEEIFLSCHWKMDMLNPSWRSLLPGEIAVQWLEAGQNPWEIVGARASFGQR